MNFNELIINYFNFFIVHDIKGNSLRQKIAKN